METRQQIRHARREYAKKSVKERFGLIGTKSGQFCYQVGMTRVEHHDELLID
jgi:hypothetical protein